MSKANAYDALNRLETETAYLNGGSPDTNGATVVVNRHEYDAIDRQTKLTFPDGLFETWDYAVCGCGTATHTDRGGIGVSPSQYTLRPREGCELQLCR